MFIGFSVLNFHRVLIFHWIYTYRMYWVTFATWQSENSTPAYLLRFSHNTCRQSTEIERTWKVITGLTMRGYKIYLWKIREVIWLSYVIMPREILMIYLHDSLYQCQSNNCWILFEYYFTLVNNNSNGL